MTILSINVNKIALLRNSRGRDYPSVVGFAQQLIGLGVKSITVHPRPDERHVTRQDVFDLSAMLSDYNDVEFNIEGYPSAKFLELVHKVKPHQCTLVPDLPDQLTSDHGWDIAAHESFLLEVNQNLSQAGIRSSLFLDPSVEDVEKVPSVQADRIELYTESYARHFGSAQLGATFDAYLGAASRATELDIGLNAGHDLDSSNLGDFLQIPEILEVSIGHAFVVECIQEGLVTVLNRYQALCAGK